MNWIGAFVCGVTFGFTHRWTNYTQNGVKYRKCSICGKVERV